MQNTYTKLFTLLGAIATGVTITLSPAQASMSTYGKFQTLVPNSNNTFGKDGDKVLYGDFDGNGSTDVMIGKPSILGTRIEWIHVPTTGAGTFGIPYIRSHGFGEPGDNFYAADFNGDGKTDILMSTTRINGDNNSATADLAWEYIPGQGVATGSGIRIANSYGIATDKYYVADFNGDRKDDVIISSTRLNADGIPNNGDLAWNYLRSNGTTFDNGGRIATSYGLDVDSYHISDFNGDNKDDVLVSSTRLNADGIAGNDDLAWNYLRSNGSTFDNGGRIAVSYGIKSFHYVIGDFTGDGKDDLAVGNGTINSNGLIRWSVVMSTGAVFSPLGIYSNGFGKTIGNDKTVFASGHFAGDKRKDLIRWTNVDGSGNPLTEKSWAFAITQNP